MGKTLSNFLTLKDLEELWHTVKRIPLGCDSIDNLLEGGFLTHSITLIYGERSSGKTQLCLQLTAHTLTTSDDYLVYIDVDSTFAPERVAAMIGAIKGSGKVDKKVLSRVMYYKPSTFEEQSNIVSSLYELWRRSHYRLVIIDSLSTLIRGEYGIATIERQRALSSYIRTLQLYALKTGVAVIATDNVYQIEDQGEENLLPSSHNAFELSTTRIRLRKSVGSKRICRVEASPLIPEGEAAFIITESGLQSL